METQKTIDEFNVIEDRETYTIPRKTKKKEEYSTASLEQALNQKTLTVDTVINILKYFEVDDLVPLYFSTESMAHMSKIMENIKLWQAKRRVLEQQVGFDLSSYVNLNSEKSERLFIFDLAEAIVSIKKMIEFEKSARSSSSSCVHITETIFFQVSQSGLIGLVFALGYLNEFRDDLTHTVDYFGGLYDIAYEGTYEDVITVSIKSGSYNTELWKKNYDHLCFDRMLAIKTLKHQHIGRTNVVCAFSGYAREMVDFMVEKFMDTDIYEDYMDKLPLVLDDIDDRDLKDKIILNLNYAYTKLGDETKTRAKQNTAFNDLINY